MKPIRYLKQYEYKKLIDMIDKPDFWTGLKLSYDDRRLLAECAMNYLYNNDTFFHLIDTINFKHFGFYLGNDEKGTIFEVLVNGFV